MGVLLPEAGVMNAALTAWWEAVTSRQAPQLLCQQVNSGSRPLSCPALREQRTWSRKARLQD